MGKYIKKVRKSTMKTVKKFIRTSRKGSEQPIWLLVAVILALVVGAALYQLVLKGLGKGTFEGMVSSMNTDTAETNMRSFCTKWMDNGWNVPLITSDYESLRRASLVLGWVTKDEYYSGDPKTSTCDCAAYLLKMGLTQSDREVIMAVSSPDNQIAMVNTGDVIIRSTDDTLRATEDDTTPRKCHSKSICYLGTTHLNAAERQTGGLGTIIDDACTAAGGAT